MKTKTFTALIYEEEGMYIARCKELFITATGVTKEEAISNLKKLIEEYSKDYKLKEISSYQSKALGEAEEIKFECNLYEGKN